MTTINKCLHRGVTLIELLVAFVIFGLFSAGAAHVLRQHTTNTMLNTINQQFYQNANLIGSFIAASPAQQWTETTVYDPSGTAVVFIDNPCILYRCKQTHVSAEINKPQSGGDAGNYWDLVTTTGTDSTLTFNLMGYPDATNVATQLEIYTVSDYDTWRAKSVDEQNKEFDAQSSSNGPMYFILGGTAVDRVANNEKINKEDQ
jgi:prepilin-type N-terminal cleavage/methylation domain-containing protein